MTGDSQRVLITAGGAGIGRAITEAFLQTGARAHIADVDGDSIAAMCEANQGVSGTITDVSRLRGLAPLHCRQP